MVRVRADIAASVSGVLVQAQDRPELGLDEAGALEREHRVDVEGFLKLGREVVGVDEAALGRERVQECCLGALVA